MIKKRADLWEVRPLAADWLCYENDKAVLFGASHWLRHIRRLARGAHYVDAWKHDQAKVKSGFAGTRGGV